MIGFTDEEISLLRKKAEENAVYIEKIMKETENVRRKLYIQQSGFGTWTHYYVCPRHAVTLKFNYDDCHNHICPIDGEVFSGEPYDGAWWAEVASQNDDACFKLAIMFMVTGNKEALDIAQNILLGYAEKYPTYEIHGGIPYNNPGKIGSQVLNDTCFLNNLVRAYDILKDTFTDDEQRLIEKNLILEGALFIKSQGTPQIHNHEVANCSTVGMAGILLGRDDLIDYAVNAKYGLKYQLDNAVLSDGMWFEGSIGYHFYSLRWFMRYERFARYTKHSLFNDKHYRKILYNMLIFPLRVIDKNGKIPPMNDNGGSFEGYHDLYEYAYSYFKTEEILSALVMSLGDKPRTDVESFVYGTYPLPEIKHRDNRNYYNHGGSNLAVIHGSDKRFLVFKATPYGGEHDHYDRLSLSFSAFGKDVCADLGTAVGYGSPYHYTYFKNTATHNTVVINGQNMAPAPTKVNAYIENAPDDIILDAQTDWTVDYDMPDSFTLKHWSDESYNGVKMRRIIRWFDKFFIDVFIVDTPHELTKDWTWHIRGTACDSKHGPSLDFSDCDTPQRFLHDVYNAVGQCDIIKSTYLCDDFLLDIHTDCSLCNMIHALGPDNPLTGNISYQLERTTAKKAVFVNVIEAHRKGEEVINAVEINNNENIKIYLNDGNEVAWNLMEYTGGSINVESICK